MNRKPVIALLAVGMSACTAVIDNHPTTQILFEPVEQSFFNYSDTLSKERPLLVFESGNSAKNCEQYFSHKHGSKIQEDTDNFRIAQEYVVCDTVNLIRKSKANKVDLGPEGSITKVLTDRLDLRSFRSSLYQRTDDNNFTLASVIETPLVPFDYGIRPALEDWHLEVRVVARLDADGDGREDWLIWLTDKAVSGTYSVMQGFVAYDVWARKPLGLEAL